MEAWVSYHFNTRSKDGFGDIGLTLDKGEISADAILGFKEAIIKNLEKKGMSGATVVILNNIKIND